MPAEFYSGTDWQQSSEPYVNRKVALAYIWPEAAKSGSGTKDALADGLHPVVAVGLRAGAERGLQPTGVVVTFDSADDIAIINFADGYIVRQYVANILTYAQAAAATFETTPYPGQPVYVDDSDDLAEGVTLSMSPLNEDDLRNPFAGVLFWCQDEYKDSGKGGPNTADQFDVVLANELVQQEYCIMLFNGFRDDA